MTRHFSTTHEWALIDGDEIVVGLSSFAAGEVGEVVHVELPTVGDQAARGTALAEIESVKAVNEFYSPVDGEVVAVNDALADSPELLNESPEGDAWFARIKPSADTPVDGLLSAEAYQDHIRS